MTDPALPADLAAEAPPAPGRRSVRQMARELDWRKAMKYSAVSIIAVPITQIILIVTHYILGWPAFVANLLAVTVTAVPAYVLNRYWVWGKKDKNNFRSEILPFWLLTFLGLVFSSLLVIWVDANFDSAILVNVANAAGFGIVWVFKFFILDKAMFGTHHHFNPEVEEALIEREAEHEAHHHHEPSGDGPVASAG
jgi:putative flippase GtrA